MNSITSYFDVARRGWVSGAELTEKQIEIHCALQLLIARHGVPGKSIAKQEHACRSLQCLEDSCLSSFQVHMD